MVMMSHQFPPPPPCGAHGPHWGLPPPLPPKALREGGEEGVAEGLALMRERRLPPSGVPWWVERVETLKCHHQYYDAHHQYYDVNDDEMR